METFAIVGGIFLLVAVVASVVVRLVAAMVSDRIRQLIVRRPLAHLLWLAGGLLAAALLVLLIWPIFNAVRHAYRPNPRAGGDGGMTVQSAPGRPWPTAPHHGR